MPSEKNSKSFSKDISCYVKFKYFARLSILFNEFTFMYFAEEGKIAFDKNERNQKNLSFKRAQYMLYDLKYVTFNAINRHRLILHCKNKIH